MPPGCPFVGMGDPKNHAFLERGCDDLHANGKAQGGKTAAEADGGKTHQVKRQGTLNPGVSSRAPEAHPFAIGFHIAQIALLNRRRRELHGGSHDHLNSLQGIIELLANDSPHSLGGYIGRRGNHQGSDLSVKKRGTVVARPGF